MKSLKLPLTIVLLLITVLSSAQGGARVISGLIVSQEDQAPLEGVTVAVKGSNYLTGSQPDGIFYLNVDHKDSVLLLQYEGYEAQEIKIGTANEYKIELKKRRNKKDEIYYEGAWRGEFQQGNVKIPFQFDIEKTGATTKAFFRNAEEHFEAGSVEIRDDSLYISIDPFHNEMVFELGKDQLRGVLRKQDGSGKSTPVVAEKGRAERFRVSEKPSVNISGKYDVLFKSADGTETRSVGLFTQQGEKLKAVFLKTTGDSRFLEGVVSGDQVQLSSFIGSSPAYYVAEINSDGSIEGQVKGLGSSQNFFATKNENASLPDPFALTYLKPGYTSFDFDLPNLSGERVSLKSDKYKGKVVIVTLTGTWCPNCIDEASFLSPWYSANKQRGVEAIAIHFERSLDPQFLEKALTGFRDRHKVQYEQLIGGIPDKKTVASTFNSLNSFLAFPTIIFINKKGDVAKIYTGYSGPATGEYHEAFIKDFNREVDKLLAE